MSQMLVKQNLHSDKYEYISKDTRATDRPENRFMEQDLGLLQAGLFCVCFVSLAATLDI